jgi:hypothetical protein
MIRTHVSKFVDEENVPTLSLAFYFFVCDIILGLNENEADESITDNFYLQVQGDEKQGHDQGIDIIYVDNSKTPPIVHLFNCKYTDKFEKTDSHFPGNEIDKINTFFQNLVSRNTTIKEHVNPVLYEKMEEIWDLYDRYSPRFELHFCSNLYLAFENKEMAKLNSILNAYSNIAVKHHTIVDFVNMLVSKEKMQINSKFKGIDRNLFEKSDGDVRALVVDVDIRDLLKIVNSDKDFRENPNVIEYAKLLSSPICEEAFESNVRMYLDQKSKINKTIKQTAHSDERFHFFYYNNGITLTCKKFEYPKGVRSPVIELTDLQVVNGSQTIHSLYEAFVENPSAFEDMDILCRIYETNNDSLSQSISEYTNSQNPVKSRDVRSNDFFQKKLEIEMKALGYFYERKKNQHKNEIKSKRIDAEIVGQALLAFSNQDPGAAKDNKREIFGDYYDTVFNDTVTSDLCLLAFLLLEFVESKRKEYRKSLLLDYNKYSGDEFILHASFYIIYTIKVLASVTDVALTVANIQLIQSHYDKSITLLRAAVTNQTNPINYRVFFKGNKAKKALDKVFESNGIKCD